MFPRETNILVVDDSMNIRQIICDNLRKIGFTHIDVAADANEAFAKLSHATKAGKAFDLVLSDLNMPGPSGLDFLKQVREVDQYKQLPFLMVTTESEKQAVIQAAISGVSGYIVKPFNIDTLTKRLGEAWAKHHP